MLFSRKDKPTSITIETGPELKHMFDSRVISVDLHKSVTEIIVLLLANHEIGMINESEYGLYAKESSHTLQRLESGRSLRENRVKSKVYNCYHLIFDLGCTLLAGRMSLY